MEEGPNALRWDTTLQRAFYQVGLGCMDLSGKLYNFQMAWLVTYLALRPSDTTTGGFNVRVSSTKGWLKCKPAKQFSSQLTEMLNMFFKVTSNAVTEGRALFFPLACKKRMTA
eukprot:Lithocolla_globosa_v1_NODE_4190_length_1490_cov_177.452265.p3 type:complete len:113 gc:universal NODE_4190_length_1490_cov_177.452265:697-1035(+)